MPRSHLSPADRRKLHPQKNAVMEAVMEGIDLAIDVGRIPRDVRVINVDTWTVAVSFPGAEGHGPRYVEVVVKERI
jgi:hypothetical protein